MLGQILNDMAKVDSWLDEYVSQEYKDQPMAQDWARISKISEEVSEVVQAYIAFTGQNPRKERVSEFDPVMRELCDVVFTAIAAMLHFTKDPTVVGQYIVAHNQHLAKRMMHDKAFRRMEAKHKSAG